MKTKLTTIDDGSKTFAVAPPVSGRKPVLALLTRLLWAAALLLPTLGTQAAVVLTTLHSFGVRSGGIVPQAAVVQGSDGNFYGTTPVTVFRLTFSVNDVNVAPVFQPVTLTNGMLSLNWTTYPGKTYQLQFSSNLSSTNWVNLGSVLTATAGTQSFSDYATNGPTRFYRVVLSP